MIFLQPGEIVFGTGCSKLCRCAGNYTLSCVDNTCDSTEECRQVGGIYGCYPKGAAKKLIYNVLYNYIIEKLGFYVISFLRKNISLLNYISSIGYDNVEK